MRTIVIREQNRATDPRLGRHVHHDSESRRFPYDRKARRELVSVQHTRNIPVLDQGNLGSCTGNAGIGCLASGVFWPTRSRDWRYSLDQAGAIALYGAATVIDPFGGQYPPTDTGSDGLSIAKALKTAGMISGYRHAFSLPDALDAIQDGPVITGVNWYQDMFHPTHEGLVRPTGGIAGGHEIVVDQYDAGRGWIGLTNSWGTGWGLGGRFFMTAEDWGALLDQQGDVTVFVPATAPPPVPWPPVADPEDDELARSIPAGWATAYHTGNNGKAARAVAKWLRFKGYQP